MGRREILGQQRGERIVSSQKVPRVQFTVLIAVGLLLQEGQQIILLQLIRVARQTAAEGKIKTVGDTVKFGTLAVQVEACRKAPPEDSPEAAAFLKITDGKADKPRTVFTGWMFASSPALSAMDDPVYDIWVVDCTSETASAAPASPTLPSSPTH